MHSNTTNSTNTRRTNMKDQLTIRVRFDGSIEISHMNESGFRHSKVYYGYDLEEAQSSYIEKEMK